MQTLCQDSIKTPTGSAVGREPHQHSVYSGSNDLVTCPDGWPIGVLCLKSQQIRNEHVQFGRPLLAEINTLIGGKRSNLFPHKREVIREY